jgi:2,3-bisphosphoglycerate-independent phosphoglycerate mutase
VRVPGEVEVEVCVKHAVKHRCAVRLRAAPGVLADGVTGTDPLVDGAKLLRCEAVDTGDAAAVRTARVVNALHGVFSEKLVGFWATYEEALRGASVVGEEGSGERNVEPNVEPNVVLLRGASEGIRVDVPFAVLHGLSAFLIAPTKIIAGIGRTVGIPVQKVDGATGDYCTDYDCKADAVTSLMLERGQSEGSAWRHDLGIVHVKAVDDAGHDGLLDKKVEHLEKVDGMVRRIAGGLARGGRGAAVVVVTGDHTTPV